MRSVFACGPALLLAAALPLAGCSEEPLKTERPTPGSVKKTEPAFGVGTSTAKPAEPKSSEPKSPDTTSASGKPTENPTANANPSKTKMSITKTLYGTLPDGKEIDEYTLTNSNGLKVKIITYGAIMTAVEAPDRNGNVENITLYRDSLADYLEVGKDGKATTPYFGATVGRYANRIANGRFTLDGKEWKLPTNNGPNSLHGGDKGFDKVVWKAEKVELPGAVGVAFAYVSRDGEQGYPGALKAKVTYTLTDKDELKMDYEATTDKDTVVNLTNHNYWNLAGAGSGDILKHDLMIDADHYLPVDSTLIPTGKLDPVKGTPFDFTKTKAIGRDMVPFDPVKESGGYDHCYVLNGKPDLTKPIARVVEPASGRVMEIYTTQPAVQFYSGNFLDGTIHAGGKTYQRHYGFCLETQHYPDSPNQKEFPTTVLKPGETYKQSTVHKFSVQK